MTLSLTSVTLAEANAFIVEHHRHHGRVVGWKFGVSCSDDGKLVGVAIVGRPVARMLQDGKTLEVTRLCTDGTPHVASKLYSACHRAASAMGYTRLLTYILDTESGTSLKAAGWVQSALSSGGSWSRESRPRIDKAPLTPKRRYEAV